MTGETRVLKIFEPFILGFCKCGCKTEIKIKNKKHSELLKYKHGHNTPTGANNRLYKGGIIITKKYNLILKRDHPFCNSNGQVFQHRAVMEEYLSKVFGEPVYLDPEEEIHHIDKDKKNNRITNMMLFPNSAEHIKFERTLDKSNRFCLWCNSNKTWTDKKTGIPCWSKHNENDFLCSKCSYKRYNRSRKKHKRRNNVDITTLLQYIGVKRCGLGVETMQPHDRLSFSPCAP